MISEAVRRLDGWYCKPLFFRSCSSYLFGELHIIYICRYHIYLYIYHLNTYNIYNIAILGPAHNKKHQCGLEVDSISTGLKLRRCSSYR